MFCTCMHEASHVVHLQDMQAFIGSVKFAPHAVQTCVLVGALASTYSFSGFDFPFVQRL